MIKYVSSNTNITLNEGFELSNINLLNASSSIFNHLNNDSFITFIYNQTNIKLNITINSTFQMYQSQNVTKQLFINGSSSNMETFDFSIIQDNLNLTLKHPIITKNFTVTPNKYAILIAGQSNAIGTNIGPIFDKNPNDLDYPDKITIQHPQSRIKTIYTGIPTFKSIPTQGFKKNEVIQARNPIPVLGPPPSNISYGGGGIYSVSFGFHFAKKLLSKLKNNFDELWILNAAYGGSSLQLSYTGTWQPNITNLAKESINHYKEAINFYKTSITKYNLIPIVLLYHGGESDLELYTNQFKTTFNKDYQKQLYLDENSLFKRLRKDIADIPIIIGLLLKNLYLKPHIGGDLIYKTHTQISKHLINSITVNMSDIQDSEPSIFLRLKMKDNTFQPLHFTAAAHRILGKRYLDAFLHKNITHRIELQLRT